VVRIVLRSLYYADCYWYYRRLCSKVKDGALCDINLFLNREYQAVNSSFSQLLYNIFGYFMAPVLSAVIMDRFTDQEAGLVWG